MILEMTTGLWVYLSTLVFVFGACVGSFLNVCIYRIPREESVVKPRSHCPRCNHMIAWYDNIPILSYAVLLRGRCRGCRQPISSRYALVETLVGALFLLAWWQYGVDARTPALWLLFSGLVMGTFVDLDHMWIPDRVTLGGIVAGLAASWLAPQLHGTADRWMGLLEGAIGAAVGGGLLYIVAFVGRLAFKKDAMGLGDVKLIAAIGAFLGWPAVIFTIMFSSLIGSVIGVTLILSGKHQWQSRLPYGPYLAVAAIVWPLAGSHWWDLYVAWVTRPLPL